MSITFLKSSDSSVYERNKHFSTYMSNSQFHSNRSISKTPSFTGAGVFIKHVDDFVDYEKLIKIFDKHYDGTAEKLLKELSPSIGQSGSRIHKNGNSISIDEKSFTRMLLESATFPVTKLPLILVNSLTNLGRKLPGVKKPAQKLYDSKTLTKLRNSLSVDEKTDMLKGILSSTEHAVKPLLKQGETLETLISKEGPLKEVSDELFKNSNRFFNTATGNYNTAYERPLNRIVTGLIPAAFLANDAFNLSVVCGDDEKTSVKEAESRKKQEISRVLTNAYIQLITLGAFTKLINSSAAASACISALTVLAAETIGRAANHKPIFFLSPEKAVEFNKKHEISEEDKKTDKKNTASTQSKVENKTSSSGKNIPLQPIKSNPHFNGMSDKNKISRDKSNEKNNEGDKKEGQKTLITFDTLKKAVSVLSLGGLTLAFMKNSTSLEKIPVYKSIKTKINSVGKFFTQNVYNKLTKKDFEVNTNDFLSTMKKLEDAGLNNIAEKYRSIAGDISNTASFKLKNGEKIIQTKTKLAPYVDAFVQPFKFMFSVINLPYRIIKGITKVASSGISNKISRGEEVGKISRGINAAVNEIFGTAKPKKPQTEKDIFAYSIGNLIKKSQKTDAGKMSLDDFRDFVQSSVQRSFNNTSQSKTSNTDLAMMTKLASSAVTSVFLIADNYNMVMLKSNGQDKENATQKAKERLIQRISGIFYQTLFMKWFNSTFESLYHKSLLGMSAVSSSNTVATEIFTRTSIGMPVQRHNYDELKAIDDKNLNRKGFLGKYFKFMSMLTGKESLGERAANGKDKQKNAGNSSGKNTNTPGVNYLEELMKKQK